MNAKEEPLCFYKITLAVQGLLFPKKRGFQNVTYMFLSSVSVYLWGFFEAVKVIVIIIKKKISTKTKSTEPFPKLY